MQRTPTGLNVSAENKNTAMDRLTATGMPEGILRRREGFAAGVAMEKGFPVAMSGADDGRDDNGEDNGSGAGTSVITRTSPKVRRPSLYRVLLLNDDYTPMEFVIEVLERFFQKNREEATRIMLHVHHHGVGECGVYTYEVAETKVTLVMDFARKHQHPLQCVMEKK